MLRFFSKIIFFTEKPIEICRKWNLTEKYVKNKNILKYLQILCEEGELKKENLFLFFYGEEILIEDKTKDEVIAIDSIKTLIDFLENIL
jgi:hypothetical protein